MYTRRCFAWIVVEGKIMWKSIALVLVFACGVVGAGSVVAVSFEARDFEALASEADQIVIGTATASNSRRTGAREIVTDYQFDDVQTLVAHIQHAEVGYDAVNHAFAGQR